MPPINIKRVAELAKERPAIGLPMSDEPTWGRELAGGTPLEAERWHAPYVKMMEILEAPDPEELDRRLAAFPKAFRAFRGALKAQHCDPDRNEGLKFRDHNLEAAIGNLWRAFMAAKRGDPFEDREAVERRGAMTFKIQKLVPKLRHIPK
jgi:hypothetical protein